VLTDWLGSFDIIPRSRLVVDICGESSALFEGGICVLLGFHCQAKCAKKEMRKRNPRFALIFDASDRLTLVNQTFG
jgi:hypothetical protein